MRRFAFLAAGAAAVALAPATVALASPPDRNVVLTTSDGVHVYGVRRQPASKPIGVILLFHQAGSSADEYATIAPKLVAMGYATLAIDQRSGGDLYGHNRTVEELHGVSAPYPAVVQDIDAAVAWAQKTYPGIPVTLWGSSYSASLVFVVAAKDGSKIARLIAFSPGEYFEDQLHVAEAAKHVTIPIFVDSAANDGEIEAARAILAASPSTVKVQFAPKDGIHGSSTLREDKDPDGYQENWQAVVAFLKQ